jgi:hypothetical protein
VLTGANEILIDILGFDVGIEPEPEAQIILNGDRLPCSDNRTCSYPSAMYYLSLALLPRSFPHQ